MASTIGASRAALKTLLDTAAATVGNALFGVQICFGPPDVYEEQDLVAILGIRDSQELSQVLGNQRPVRRERYDIRVAVKCHKPEGSAADVETRCVAMYEALRTVVLTNDRLGLAATAMAWCLPVGQESDGPVPVRKSVSEGREVQDGWVMQMDMFIECVARA